MHSISRKPKVIVICGPTGIGKTAVGIELAGKFGGEIISADSMQIYRQMDIGTAKPTLAEQAQSNLEAYGRLQLKSRNRRGNYYSWLQDEKNHQRDQP